MKVGDLVKFVAPAVFSGAEREYAKSGIVTEISESTWLGKTQPSAAKVYWSDGRQTREHFCYLERLKNESR